jgi:DegV family protein with EDD domain
MEVTMSTYKIISDSSCDLPESYRKKLDIGLVPYYVTLDNKTYLKEIVELQPREFYEKIITEQVFPKTSLPPIQDYIDVFEPYLKQGMDIICMCLTSKFSGSYQSAINAKNILLETYPDSRIEVFDTILATAGQGLIVYEAARMKAAGYSLDQLIEALNRLKDTAKINFTVDSLEHLQKGGRIGKASALAGMILNIKPIIVLKNGELMPHSKVRGHKKAIKTILDMTVDEIGAEKEKYHVCLINSYRDEDAAQLQKTIVEDYGFSILEPIFDIGVTIGTHAGPTAIGICYIKKYEYLD